MVNLIDLLRKNKCEVKYDKNFNIYLPPNDYMGLQLPMQSYSILTDEQLLSQIIELNCSHQFLTNLPDLPNCQKLNCGYNELTNLPKLPNCKKLYCRDNKLTNLPE